MVYLYVFKLLPCKHVHFTMCKYLHCYNKHNNSHKCNVFQQLSMSQSYLPHATLLLGSPLRHASRIASDIWSHILSTYNNNKVETHSYAEEFEGSLCIPTNFQQPQKPYYIAMGVRAGIMIPSASQISYVVVTPLRACTTKLTIRFCSSVSQLLFK